MHLGNYCGNIDIFIPNLDRRCNALSIMVLLGGGPLNIEVRIHFTLYCDIHIRAMPAQRTTASVITNNLILGSVFSGDSAMIAVYLSKHFLESCRKATNFLFLRLSFVGHKWVYKPNILVYWRHFGRNAGG